MSYDTARLNPLVVLNGASRSNIYDVHLTFGDATGIVIYAPASLNTGVFVIEVANEDTGFVWVPLKDAAGVAVAPPAVAEARVYVSWLLASAMQFSFRASTPPNADTTFKLSKQFVAFGISF